MKILLKNLFSKYWKKWKFFKAKIPIYLDMCGLLGCFKYFRLIWIQLKVYIDSDEVNDLSNETAYNRMKIIQEKNKREESNFFFTEKYRLNLICNLILFIW